MSEGDVLQQDIRSRLAAHQLGGELEMQLEFNYFYLESRTDQHSHFSENLKSSKSSNLHVFFHRQYVNYKSYYAPPTSHY